MSSCTERFPVIIQSFILNKLKLLDKESSETWRKLVSCRVFTYSIIKVEYINEDIIESIFAKKCSKLFLKHIFRRYYNSKFKSKHKYPFKSEQSIREYLKLIFFKKRDEESDVYILRRHTYEYKVFKKCKYSVGQPMGMYSS